MKTKLCLAVFACIALMDAAFAAGEMTGTTADYAAQDDLIACWDGVENSAVGRYSGTITEWKDLVGARAFALKNVTVGINGITFKGEQSSYGELSGTDTDAVFLTASKGGTVEIVFTETSDQTKSAFVLQTYGTAGVMLNRCFNSEIGNYIILGMVKDTYPSVAWSWQGNECTTASICYENGAWTKFYGDADQKEERKAAYWSGGTTKKTVIGNRASLTADYPFTGTIHAIRVYKRQLTADEIAYNRQVDDYRFVQGQAKAFCSVTVTAAENGTVSSDVEGVCEPGRIATLTATPAEGYAFGCWTGTGVDPDHKFDNPYRGVILSDMALTANFRQKVYLSKTGNDDNDGLTWDTALATFKAAINKVPNAYVMVGEGVYNVSTAVNVTNEVTICGSGTRGTVVKLSEQPSTAGDAIRSVFYVKHSGARLTNLALTTGGSARGRGAYLSSGQIDNCSITNCMTVNGNMNGGGLYVVSGVVRNCLVQHNEANSSGGSNKQGGGVWMSGGLVDSCTIRDNYAAYKWGTGDGSGCGGGVWMKGGTLRSCLVTLNGTTGNTSGYGKGAGVYAEGSATIENSTIVKNKYSGTQSLTGGMTASGSSVTVRNTIIQLNENDSGVSNFTRSSAKLENVNSTATGVEGIFNGDPAFVDAENGDWHIGYGSCVDVGEVADWMKISTDLDGNARVFGEKVDCGCYEFVSRGLSCGFDATTDGALDEAEVTLTGSVVGADPEDVTFSWKIVDSKGKVTERSDKGLAEVVLSMPAGFYSVTLSVSNGISSDEMSRDNAFTVFARDIYVDAAGANTLPYADFASAATNLAEALKLAAGGSVVHLADGVHRVSEPLVLTRGIVVTHDGAREDCIVTGNTGDSLFMLNSSGARLENIDICGIYPRLAQDGRTGSYVKGKYQTMSGVRIGTGGGSVTNCIIESCYGETHGAGVLMSAGRLVDSVVRGNLAFSTGGAGFAGGGIDMDGGLVDRCIITNNLTTYGSVSAGGGVRVAGSGVLRNSFIAYNYSSGEGGGARVMGAGKMENCTVVGNTANGEGAAGVNAFLDYPSAHPQVVNTIIWGNTNTTDKVLRETSGTVSAFDTCWTSDPVFRRSRTNWCLRSASPCRDAAKKLDWMDDAVDLYGNPRIRYGTSDIGAVESEDDPGLVILIW